MSAARSIRAGLFALSALSALTGACADMADGGPPDGGMDGGVCSTFLSLEPDAPVASPTARVRANANVSGAPGVLAFSWTVTFAGTAVPHEPAQADNSAILFPAAVPGVYAVSFAVSGPVACPTAQAQLNVQAPGANQVQLRLRATPPASSTVPPHEELVIVPGGGGAYSLGTISLDPGVAPTAAVQSSGAGVAAYLRFMPLGAREAAVEAFSSDAGGVAARVQSAVHDVLVIPASPALAPRLVSGWTPPATALAVSAGSAVTGTVRGPGGAPLAGAKVQLKSGEVPSTVGTTAANGAFTVRFAPVAGAVISVDVAPPTGSGLPRLLAQGAFDLAASIEVAYAATTLRDLGGAVLRRGGAPLPGARIIIVGTVPNAGLVTVGASSAGASGVVRVAAVANGAGALPATLAPARALSAVVEVAPGDHAVAAIDLTAAAPASIEAPPPVPFSTELRRPGGQPIAEAVIDAVPTGALALAGVSSAVRARASGGGQAAASLAAGGRYDLRIHDPAHARGAQLLVADVPASGIAASYTLPAAMVLTGALIREGNPGPVGGAAVQVFCVSCTGLDRDRPIAEATSRPDGTFRLAIPDPGTN